MIQTGDQCPKRCGGRVRIVGTRPDGSDRVRYLACTACGARATQIVPLSEAPRQDGVGRPRATNANR